MKKWQCSKIIYLILLLGFFFCIIIFIDFQNIYIYKIFFWTIYIFNIFLIKTICILTPRYFSLQFFIYRNSKFNKTNIVLSMCWIFFCLWYCLFIIFSNIYINALNILNLSALCFLQATQKSATTNEIDWNELNGRIEIHYYKRI